MVSKVVAFFALVAVASASDLSSFSYSVADPYTGDFKNQVESRDGDNVQGQYSLLEADGSRRTVDYAAGVGGFNAVVRKDPGLIATAPLVSAPIAPVARFGGIAPVAALGGIAPIARFGGIAPIAPLGGIAPIARIGGIAPVAGLGGIVAPFPYARYY